MASRRATARPPRTPPASRSRTDAGSSRARRTQTPRETLQAGSSLFSWVRRPWAGWTRSREFWTSLPNSALVLVLGAVFCLFSTLAFTTDIATMGRMSWRGVTFAAILSGGTAAMWLLALARGLRFVPVAIALHLFAITNSVVRPLPQLIAPPHTAASLQSRLRFDSFALTTVIMLGYGLFIGFIAGQGRRYMRVRTEIALATEIHQ